MISGGSPKLRGATCAVLLAGVALGAHPAGATTVALDPGSTVAFGGSASAAGDGSGGAYFAWLRQTSRSDSAEAVVCHIPAGAAACQSTQALPNYVDSHSAPQAPSTVNLAYDSGSGALYATTDGANTPILTYASTDGGRTYSAPTSPSGSQPSASAKLGQTVFGPSNLLVGSFAADTGTVVDAFSPPGTGAGFAAMPGTNGSGSSTIGLSGTSLVEVSNDNLGPRRTGLDVWSYHGDFSQSSLDNSSNWGSGVAQAILNDVYPRESGAPGPVALISQSGSGNSVRVWQGSSFGSPVNVGELGTADDTDSNDIDIAAGAPQTIYAGGANDACGIQLTASSDGGQTFGKPYVVFPTASNLHFQFLRIVAQGQGGWALFEANNAVFATSFTSTPSPSCSSAPSTPTTPAAPVLSGFSVKPKTVSTAGRIVNGKCAPQTRRNAAAKKCRRPIRVRLKYTLNASASVYLTIAKHVPGRKVNGKCVKQTQKNHKRPRCNLSVMLPGFLGLDGKAGSNTYMWTIGKGGLGPGTYTLTVAPVSGHPQDIGGRPRSATLKVT